MRIQFHPRQLDDRTTSTAGNAEQQRRHLERYGHNYEVALALGVTPAYPPAANAREAEPVAHVQNTALALHQFYSARTPDQRNTALRAIETAGRTETAGDEHLRARIVDAGLRLEEARTPEARRAVLAEMAQLEQQNQWARSAVDHLRLNDELGRVRTEHAPTIARASNESHDALQAYLAAQTPEARAGALQAMRTAADRLPTVQGARNVLSDMHGRAELHNLVTGVNESQNADQAAAAIARLQTAARTNPDARAALERITNGNADRALQDLRGADPDVRDRAMRELRNASSPATYAEELRNYAAPQLDAVRNQGLTVDNLLQAHRTEIRERANANQRQIETAYERFLEAPSAANLEQIQRLNEARIRDFARRDMDFTHRDAQMLEALHRLHTGDSRRALGDLETLAQNDSSIALMLGGAGGTADARAQLTEAELRRRLPSSNALLGERRGLIALPRLDATSSAADYERAARALEAAPETSATARAWAPWARAHVHLAQMREAIGANNQEAATTALRDLERLAANRNIYAQSGLVGLLVPRTEREGRPIYAPELPRGMGGLRDRAASAVRNEMHEGRYTLTHNDASALARAYADAAPTPEGRPYGLRSIFDEALSTPRREQFRSDEEYERSFYRWDANGRAALSGLTEQLRTRGIYGPRAREESRALADLMLTGSRHDDFMQHAMSLGPAASRHNVGAMRVLSHVVANGERAEHIDGAAAFLHSASQHTLARVSGTSVAEELAYHDRLGRARNPGAIAQLMVRTAPYSEDGSLPAGTRTAITDALRRTGGRLDTADHERAIRALFESRNSSSWGYGAFADTVMANRTPQMLNALRQNQAELSAEQARDLHFRLRQNFTHHTRTTEEAERDLRTFAAIGGRASLEDLRGLQAGMTRFDQRWPYRGDQARFATEGGRALVQTMARNQNEQVRAEAERMFTGRAAWPGMGEQERDALLGYLRSRGTDLAGYDRISQSAYGAGLPRPVGLVLRDLGVQGDDRTLATRGQELVQRIGDEDRTRRALGRVGLLGTMPGDVRAQAFGEQFGGGFDTQRVITDLAAENANGNPLARAVLRDGDQAIENTLRTNMDRAYVRESETRQERERALRNERERLQELRDQTGRGPSFWGDLVAFLPDSYYNRFTAEQNGLIERFRSAERDSRVALFQEGEATYARRTFDMAHSAFSHSQALARGDFPTADRIALNMFGENGNSLQDTAPSIWNQINGPAWARLRATRQVGLDAPPARAPGSAETAELAMRQLRAGRDLSPPERAQLMRQIDAHPLMAESFGYATQIQQGLGLINDLYSSAIGGGPDGRGGTRPNGTVRDEYVDLVRERSRELQQMLGNANARVPELRALRDQLREEAGRGGGHLLRERANMIDGVLRLVDPSVEQGREPNQGQRVAIDQLLRTTTSEEFGPNTWANWARRDLPVLGTALAASVATVMTFGAATPIFVTATAGAVSYFAARELAREGFHHLRQAGIDIGSGRSLAGAWANGDLVFDRNSGRFVPMNFWEHVGTPYGIMLAKSAMIGLAATAVGPAATQMFNAMGPRLAGTLEANAGAIQRLTAGAQDLIQRTAGNPAQQTFVRRFMGDFANGAVDIALMNTTEHALRDLLNSRSDLVGIASVGLVAFGRGMYASRRGRTNQIQLEGNVTPELVAELNQGLRNRNFQTVLERETGLLHVRGPNGTNFTFGSRTALDRLAGRPVQPPAELAQQAQQQQQQAAALPQVRATELRLGNRIGGGAHSDAHLLGENEVAVMLRREAQGGESAAHLRSQIEYMQQASRVTFEGTNVAPQIRRIITDGSGNPIGYVVERVPGRELGQLAERGLLTEAQLTEVGRQLQGQLGALHERGLIHGDANLGNIIVETLQGGRVRARLLDFERPTNGFGPVQDRQLLDRTLQNAAHMRQPEVVAQFMAREQAQQQAAATGDFIAEQGRRAMDIREQLRQFRRGLPEGDVATREMLSEMQRIVAMNGTELRNWRRQDFDGAGRALEQMNALERLRQIDVRNLSPELRAIHHQLTQDMQQIMQRWRVQGEGGAGAPTPPPQPLQTQPGGSQPIGHWLEDWRNAGYDPTRLDGMRTDLLRSGTDGVRRSLEAAGVRVPREQLDDVMRYLFDGPGIAFTRPNYEAWNRLANGRGTARDVAFVVHERAELEALGRIANGFDYMGANYARLTAPQQAAWRRDFGQLYTRAHEQALLAEYQWMAGRFRQLTGRELPPQVLASVNPLRAEDVLYLQHGGQPVSAHANYATWRAQGTEQVALPRATRELFERNGWPTTMQNVIQWMYGRPIVTTR